MTSRNPGHATWGSLAEVAANFGCNQFRIMPEIVYKLFVLSFEVAVLFYSNLNGLPFFGYVVNLDLVLCTGFNLEHVVCPLSFF